MFIVYPKAETRQGQVFPVFITREEDGTNTLHTLKQINRKETQLITMAQISITDGVTT
jgi:hypothetical protein